MKDYKAVLKIGDNVVIGARVIILPNVRIGNNVIVGADSIVTRDIPSNSVAVEIPCKRVTDFYDYCERQITIKTLITKEYWESFYAQRNTNKD